jgi:DNA-binding transcriptional LysR family regulator
MWRTVELRELRVFFELCEQLHFGRSADRLGLTQSRVSQCLRQLESKLGCVLFDRTSRRVALTRDGELLRDRLGPHYRMLFAELEAAATSADRIGGTLRIGLLSPVSAGPHLTEIIRRFEKLHPEAHVEVVELSFADPLGPLRRREIEAMASRLPLRQPDLTIGPILSRERRVLAVARDHPLAARATVTTEDIADYLVAPIEGWPQEMLEALVPVRSRTGRPIDRLPGRRITVGEVTNLVALGRIIHPTVPSFADHFGHPGIVYRPIEDLPDSTTGLISLKNPDPTLREFLTMATQVIAERDPAAD